MDRAAFVQIATVLAADLSSFGMGFILGYSAIALPQLQHPDSWLPLTDDEASWFASLPALTISVGGVLAGYTMEKLGRKRTLQVQCIPTLIGWVLLACAKSVTMLYAGRLLTGFGGGMVDSTIQVYIGEVTTPRLRNSLGPTPCLVFSVGMLLVYALGAFHLPWNVVAGISALVPFCAMIALFFLPESPVWLQGKGKHVLAEKAMDWLRRDPQDCEELRNKKLVSEDSTPVAPLTLREIIRPVAVLMGLFFFQQFSGMNAVTFYAVQMFQGSEADSSGLGLDEHSAAVVIGLTRLIVICIACPLLSKLGRRPVAMLSGLGMAASMLSLGAVIQLYNGAPPLPAALTCLTGFIASNTFGFFFVPWVMLGELLPEQCRGRVSGVMASVVYLFIFVIVKLYPFMLATLGQTTVFWIFGGVSLAGSTYVYFFLPETKGKSLDEIEAYFKKH